VAAEVLFKHVPPGDEAEAETVVDHGVAPAGEIGRADERAADIFAHLGPLEGPPARLRHLVADPLLRNSIEPFTIRLPRQTTKMAG
jgi:hypothetical protein